MAPVAVVTGANRGLGLGTARFLAGEGFTVVLTARDLGKAEAAAASIDGEVLPFALDVTSDDDAKALAAFVGERFGRVDVLVNNAGAIFDPGDTLTTPGEVLVRSVDTNAVGAWRVTTALANLLREARGTVTNVSSGMGALNEMGGGYPGYRVSKAALNAITRVLDHELHGVRVNSVCPGWVKTDMGGAGATRELEEGVASITWAALLPEDGPTGGFFRDGQRIDW